jgi:C4-type Zn-finger protein
MPNEQSDSERLTRQETRLETIEGVVTRLETKIDAWQTNFVSRELLEEKLERRDERIERLEEDKSTDRHLFPVWVSAAISLAALLVALWSHVK